MNTQAPLKISGWAQVRALLPGLVLCLIVTLVAYGLQAWEEAWLGRSWLEALVLAIVLGTLVRSLWTPPQRWELGIHFCAKQVLEVAVVLLGTGISAHMLADVGWALLLGIAGVVFAAIGISYGLGRLFGLPQRMAVLIACGNSICGNSAIAAVAPVIDAHSDDVAAAIAFTAVLGVAVVLGLPALAFALHMSAKDFGIFAGLTVYAVPQVLAATAPVASLAAQVGTLVKLVRVLMLGPVVLVLSLWARCAALDAPDQASQPSQPNLPIQPGKAQAAWSHVLPWFILGFLLMVALRSFGLTPAAWVSPILSISSGLTVLSMAALGLGVDIRVVAQAGPRVTAVVSLSLLALGGIAWGLIQLL